MADNIITNQRWPLKVSSQELEFWAFLSFRCSVPTLCGLNLVSLFIRDGWVKTLKLKIITLAFNQTLHNINQFNPWGGLQFLDDLALPDLLKSFILWNVQAMSVRDVYSCLYEHRMKTNRFISFHSVIISTMFLQKKKSKDIIKANVNELSMPKGNCTQYTSQYSIFCDVCWRGCSADILQATTPFGDKNVLTRVPLLFTGCDMYSISKRERERPHTQPKEQQIIMNGITWIGLSSFQ